MIGGAYRLLRRLRPALPAADDRGLARLMPAHHARSWATFRLAAGARRGHPGQGGAAVGHAPRPRPAARRPRTPLRAGPERCSIAAPRCSARRCWFRSATMPSPRPRAASGCCRTTRASFRSQHIAFTPADAGTRRIGHFGFFGRRAGAAAVAAPARTSSKRSPAELDEPTAASGSASGTRIGARRPVSMRRICARTRRFIIFRSRSPSRSAASTHRLDDAVELLAA